MDRPVLKRTNYMFLLWQNFLITGNTLNVNYNLMVHYIISNTFYDYEFDNEMASQLQNLGGGSFSDSRTIVNAGNVSYIYNYLPL